VPTRCRWHRLRLRRTPTSSRSQADAERVGIAAPMADAAATTPIPQRTPARAECISHPRAAPAPTVHKVSLPNDTASPAADRKVRRFCFLPLPLAGEGRGGGASAHSARRVDRFPPPAALYERVDLPRKRERLSAPPRAISGSHFKQPDTTSPSRGTIRPRFAWTVSLQKIRGRREDRVRAAPAVSCAMCIQRKTHTSIQVQRKHSGLPCAMVLRLISCSPR